MPIIEYLSHFIVSSSVEDGSVHIIDYLSDFILKRDLWPLGKPAFPDKVLPVPRLLLGLHEAIRLLPPLSGASANHLSHNLDYTNILPPLSVTNIYLTLLK